MALPDKEGRRVRALTQPTEDRNSMAISKMSKQAGRVREILFLPGAGTETIYSSIPLCASPPPLVSRETLQTIETSQPLWHKSTLKEKQILLHLDIDTEIHVRLHHPRAISPENPD